MLETMLKPRSPFDGLNFQVPDGPGVLVAGRGGLGICTVRACRGRSAQARQRLRLCCGAGAGTTLGSRVLSWFRRHRTRILGSVSV